MTKSLLLIKRRVPYEVLQTFVKTNSVSSVYTMVVGHLSQVLTRICRMLPVLSGHVVY